MKDEHKIYQIAPELRGCRLDQALARIEPSYSRSRWQGWLRDGRVLLDGAPAAPRHRLHGGEQVEAHLPVAEPRLHDEPEPLTLHVVYQDADLLVLDKPAGLVVHPGAGNRHGTLLNALLAHDPTLRELPRAGLVHRLDKDTTGLMMVARSELAHRRLIAALAERRVSRRYAVLVRGAPLTGFSVDEPIGRHPVQRTRMAVHGGGRAALTHFRISRRLGRYTLLEARLESGRTHQIRVHLKHAGYPVLGDPVYGTRLQLPKGADDVLATALRGLRRQALHAEHLEIEHPRSAEPMHWHAPMPADLARLVSLLDQHGEAATP